MTPDCRHDREPLGAFALGGLDDADAETVRRQIEACDACRAEYEELAGLPGLLELARSVPHPVPARVRDRVVAAAARRRTRRRWATGLVAASLAAAVAGGVVGQQLASPPAEVMVPAAAVEPFDAHGEVVFLQGDEQVVVRIELEGLQPLDEPGVYEAWMYRGDERVVSIGQLEVVDGHVTAELTADGSLDDYSGFWITAEPDRRDPAHDGPTVVRASVPRW